MPDPSVLPDIELLSARTEQLVELMRVAGARLDELCCRPQVVLQQAQTQSAQLSALGEKASALSAQLEPRIEAAKELRESIESRTAALQDVLNLTEAAAKGLMERVRRAQQLAEHFNGLVKDAGQRMQGFERLIGQAESTGRSTGEQTAAAEKAAAEAAQAASLAAQAARQLNELGSRWQGAAASLASEQRKLIDASRSATGELHLLIGQATRLEEAFRREAGSLGAMLDRAAAERQTWSAFLDRLPRRARPSGTSARQVRGPGQPISGPGYGGCGSKAVPETAGRPIPAAPMGPRADAGAAAALAARIRRLAGLVRQAGQGAPRRCGPRQEVSAPHRAESV